MDSRRVGVDEHFCFRFVTGQGTLPWQPKIAKIFKIRLTFALPFHNRWEDWNADGYVNTKEVPSM